MASTFEIAPSSSAAATRKILRVEPGSTASRKARERVEP
jgi:hypothetical protein